MADPTHAESLYALFNGKYVQIYLGDNVGTRSYADDDVENKAIIRGKVIRAEGEWLILLCEFKVNKSILTSEILINGWTIKGIMENNPKLNLGHALNVQEQRRVLRR